MGGDPLEQLHQHLVFVDREALHHPHSQGSGSTLFGVLDAIEARGQDGACAVSDVAAALGVDQPRGSRLVLRATEEGWVTRRTDPSDARRTLLALTDEGQEQVDRAHRFRQEAFARATADWPDVGGVRPAVHRAYRYMGRRSGASTARAAGRIVVPGTARRRQRAASVASAIVASVSAKSSPMHRWVPRPKGA
ncbi:hypothetical protein SABIM44S_04973 [Streptomyces abikoensis]